MVCDREPLLCQWFGRFLLFGYDVVARSASKSGDQTIKDDLHHGFVIDIVEPDG